MADTHPTGTTTKAGIVIRFTAPFARLVGTVIDGVDAAVGVYDDWRWARFDRRRVREAQASARAAHPTARQAAER